MKRKRLMILVEKELVEASRNRLIYGFGIVFFTLALAMSLIGFLSPGANDVQFSRVGVSLLNLATLLVPLIGLVVGSQGFAGEFEDGTMELLLTQPVSLSAISLGRILGQWMAIAASLLTGFGASGIVLLFLSADRQVLPFIVNLGISLALTLVFLVIGTLISVRAKNRMTALFTALGVWFFAVILYDIIVTQVLMVTSGVLSMDLLYVLLVLNPADLLRVLAIRLTGVKELFGPATEAMIVLPGFKGPLLATLAWIVWSLGMYGLTVHSLFKRVYPLSRNGHRVRIKEWRKKALKKSLAKKGRISCSTRKV